MCGRACVCMCACVCVCTCVCACVRALTVARARTPRVRTRRDVAGFHAPARRERNNNLVVARGTLGRDFGVVRMRPWQNVEARQSACTAASSIPSVLPLLLKY